MGLHKFFTLLVVAIGCAFAVQAKETPEMGIVTGPTTGTYYRFGHDIANALKHYGVDMEVKESQGSVENVRRINSTENASLGIVQSDLLGFLKRSDDQASQNLAEHLRVVFPFYKEEIHLFARNEIKSLADLNGKRLVVGAEGSGHWLTSMNILAMTEVKPGDLQRLEPAEGVVAVLQNRADALIFVGGKPVKLFENLEDLSNSDNSKYTGLLKEVHFVPLNDPKLLKEYSATQLTSDDYAFIETPIDTVAVQAVLMSYGFEGEMTPYQKERCGAIGNVGTALREALPHLRKNGHPKWKEVSLQMPENHFWKVDQCVASVFATPKGANALENALLKTIQKNWDGGKQIAP